MNTSMRNAFMAAQVSPGFIKTPVGKKVEKSFKRNAGVQHQGRGWKANLSARTLKTLTEQGVFG